MRVQVDDKADLRHRSRDAIPRAWRQTSIAGLAEDSAEADCVRSSLLGAVAFHSDWAIPVSLALCHMPTIASPASRGTAW